LNTYSELPHAAASCCNQQFSGCVQPRNGVWPLLSGARHIFAAWRIQKRKRNPAVGSMRWRKPESNPLFTCENMKPK
jgi:hypothetical protein